MPTVSAAVGCSPTARTRSPHRVLNSPTWTKMISDVGDVQEDDESKKTGPMIGMSPSSGILIGQKVEGEFSEFAYGTRARSYRNPVSPECEHVEHDAEDDLVNQVA